jgi:hypothetical protein
MLPFASSFAAISIAFILPALAGLLLVTAASKVVRPVYIAAFAFGIYLWFFNDTLGGSASLDVNSGFSGGLPQIAVFALFVLGALILFSIDRGVFTSGIGPGNVGLVIPLIIAFAVGIHGAGEGAAFSSTAAATTSSSLLDAFGGLSSAVAFIFHKLLESMMVGAAYWIYAEDRGRDVRTLARDTLVLALAFAIPGLLGAATDYSLNYDTTYLFALGLGTSLYAAVRLVKPMFSISSESAIGSIRLIVCSLLGFTCIYLAALLHS